MADRFEQFLKDLKDRTKYVCVPGVNIFDEHQDPPRKKGGKGRRFAKKDLEELARVNNERTRKGDVTPLAYGHTNPRDPDEANQPEPRGYALNYHVAYDRRHKKWMLRADYYIRADEYNRAVTYPFTSIELWPDDGTIHPVSLLRRTPQRPLGNWHFSRFDPAAPAGASSSAFSRAGRTVLRYAMEFKPMPEEFDDVPAHDEAPPPAEHHEPDGDEGHMTDEEHEQYMRHVHSHPLAMKYAKHCSMKYAMPEEEAPPPGDPAGPPAADEGGEEPEQHGAFAGPTNGGAPLKPEQHGKNGAASRLGRQGRTERQARKGAPDQNARIAALERELAESDALTLLHELDGEGYEFDGEGELKRMVPMTKAQRRQHCEHIRRYYRQAPTAHYGRVPVDDSRPQGDEPSQRDHDLALQYMREHGGSMGYPAALEAVRKKK